MRGCDLILDLLISLGVDTYFVLTGGAKFYARTVAGAGATCVSLR